MEKFINFVHFRVIQITIGNRVIVTIIIFGIVILEVLISLIGTLNFCYLSFHFLVRLFFRIVVKLLIVVRLLIIFRAEAALGHMLLIVLKGLAAHAIYAHHKFAELMADLSNALLDDGR